MEQDTQKIASGNHGDAPVVDRIQEPVVLLGNPMRYWIVEHRHTSYIEAETESDAIANAIEQVRDNAEESDCEATEIDQKDYDQFWEIILNRQNPTGHILRSNNCAPGCSTPNSP